MTKEDRRRELRISSLNQRNRRTQREGEGASPKNG
jgi:hypothetical protein